MPDDKNRMTYWWPRIVAVIQEKHLPNTEIVRFPGGRELSRLLDGEMPKGFDAFISDLDAAAELVGGYPIFLRHDLSSAKHGWLRTCYVEDAASLSGHVVALMDHWYGVNFFADGGEEAWAVREYVPVFPHVMTAFEEMPIGPERRYVVRDGEVLDHFPYWPLDAFKHEPMDEGELLRNLGEISLEYPEEIAELSALASAAGKALGGEWTIDFMHTWGGWLLIDCAQLKDSWLPSAADRAMWYKARKAIA